MSGSRADRLERLKRVQEKRRAIEEWRLADLRRRDAALAAEAHEILDSLGETTGLSGLFLEAKASTLKHKEGERTRLVSQEAAVRERLREAQGMEKRLERLAGEARRGEDARAEAVNLSDTLEAYLAARGASLE